MASSFILFAYFADYFFNKISPELMKIFANGKQSTHSFVEVYLIHL